MSHVCPRFASSLGAAAVIVALGLTSPLAQAAAPVAVAAHPEPVVSASSSTLSASATAASIGPAVTRAQVMHNAMGWLAYDPPYSQSAYYPGIQTPTTKYRTDCSGFVSMAWNVYVNAPGSISTGGYVTWTLPSVAVQLASTSLLQPGDILDYPYHHVILFTGWVDRTAGTFSYIAQTAPGLNMQFVDTESVNTGNISGYPHNVFIPYRYKNIVDSTPTGVRGDWDSNGTVDLLARNGTDRLYEYEGNGRGGFGFSRAAPIATGYGSDPVVVRSPSLVTGTLAPDVVTIDKGGAMWVVPGTGLGSFAPRTQIGQGMAGYRLLAPGDLNRDGKNDLLAIAPDGSLLLYPGTGAPGVGTPVKVGAGWSTMTAVAVGDFNADGKPDMLSTSPSGTLAIYPGNGLGGFGVHTNIGRGWVGWKLVGPGDFNGDHKADLVGIDSLGDLWLYPGTGTGMVGPRVHLASHWGAITLL